MKLRILSWQNPVVLIICFLLIVSVRFNRNSLLFKRDLSDAAFYMSNVDFFRGDKISYALRAPFNERLLVTFTAAVLPLDPMTAINVTNVIFLLLALYFLFKNLKLFNLDERLIWGGLYLFVFSFPTFYYSTIGYVDAGVLLMLFAGTYAIYSNRYWLFIIAVILGTVAKEGIVLLVPVAIAYGYASDNKKWYILASVALVLYLAIWGIIKHYLPNTAGNTPVLFWTPISRKVISNLHRTNFYVSSILSFGIPGVLCLWLFFKNSKNILLQIRHDLPLLAGIFFTGLLWTYSFFSAYCDGRFFWIGYIFPILLSMNWWDRFGSPFSNISRRLHN